MRPVACTVLAAVVVAAAACGPRIVARATQTSCEERAPGASLATGKRDSITDAMNGNWPDAGWAEIARVVAGGFAGIYFEHPDSVPADVRRIDGHPVRQRTIVRLVHPEQKADALRALRVVVTTVHRSGGFDLVDPRIERARWDFAQLFDWYRYLSPHLWAIPGVTMSDIDEVENRIVFGALTPNVERQVLARAAELGAPCGLVRTTHAAVIRVEPMERLSPHSRD